MIISDEKLMAYVDGELDPVGRAAVAAAIAADPALARKVARHRRLRERFSGIRGRELAEAPPPALVAVARGQSGGTVVDLAAARARRAAAASSRQAPPWRRWGAFAACLAVGVGASLFALRRSAPAPIGFTAGGLAAQGALARALETETGGSPVGGAAAIGVSFRTADHRYCRTFQLDHGQPLAGIACREDAGWRVRVLAVAGPPPPASEGYRTAATTLPPAVAASLDAMIEGAPLDAQGEAAAKARGWRTP